MNSSEVTQSMADLTFQNPITNESTQVQQQGDGENDAEPDDDAIGMTPTSTVNSRLDADQLKLIELQGLPFEEYIQRMIEQFGESQTKIGFEIINKNKKICFEENSEDIFTKLLEQSGVKFQDEETTS